MYKEWLYKKDGEYDVRYCPVCLYHKIKTNRGDWVVLITYEHAAWVAEQWLNGNDGHCADCDERFDANKEEFWGD